jgi:protein O-GlcNAc transferase
MLPLDAHLADAQRLMDSGLTAAARARLESVVAQHPDAPIAHFMLGVCLSRLNEFAPAVERYRRVLVLGMVDAHLLTLLGEGLRNLGRFEEAMEPFRRAAALEDATVTRVGLAQTLLLAKRYMDAIAECRAILEPARRARTPVSPVAESSILSCMAMALERLGHAEEAVVVYKRAAALDPRSHLTASGLCAAMNYASGYTAREIREAHEAYGRIVEQTLSRPDRVMHGFAPGAALKEGEPLRVGIVSPDLRRHAVACFLLPLVEHLDRSRIELCLYSASRTEDEITARLRAGARLFRSVVGQNGETTARAIAADRVHVLIEAAGHTMNTRLPMLALRPAPVQVLYLGYPGTSGVRSVDWRLVDSVSDPPGAEAFSTERLWRLDPCHLVYRPLIETPEVDPIPPSQRPGAEGITFGSFSTASKMTAEVLPAWSSLLKKVAGSRLLLKHERTVDEQTRADLTARFQAEGLGPDRVLIETPEPGGAGGLMRHYNRVDIALDTFPYSGTTTVCEALTMGVPVVARPGETTASRASIPILASVGLQSLAASTTDQFIEIAARLASDPSRLSELRRELPRRMHDSAVGDYPGFARRFEGAMLGMWEDWAARGGRGSSPA